MKPVVFLSFASKSTFIISVVSASTRQLAILACNGPKPLPEPESPASARSTLTNVDEFADAVSQASCASASDLADGCDGAVAQPTGASRPSAGSIIPMPANLIATVELAASNKVWNQICPSMQALAKEFDVDVTLARLSKEEWKLTVKGNLQCLENCRKATRLRAHHDNILQVFSDLRSVKGEPRVKAQLAGNAALQLIISTDWFASFQMIVPDGTIPPGVKEATIKKFACNVHLRARNGGLRTLEIFGPASQVEKCLKDLLPIIEGTIGDTFRAPKQTKTNPETKRMANDVGFKAPCQKPAAARISVAGDQAAPQLHAWQPHHDSWHALQQGYHQGYHHGRWHQHLAAQQGQAAAPRDHEKKDEIWNVPWGPEPAKKRQVISPFDM